VALLLPGLLLRALIPIGFMPMAGPGFTVRIVMCPGYAPVPSAAAELAAPMNTPMDMSMDMPMDAMDLPAQHPPDAAPSGKPAPAHQDQGSCPYGASPALGALPEFATLQAAAPPPPVLAVPAAQIDFFTVSFRAQSPRGPPA
jgi:hypothetical protein